MTDTMAHTQPASPASPAPTITAPGGRFVFGGDWNPEQWDESTWADDIAKLERAGINEATINVFSWALIQPDESRYDFAMLDRIVELLAPALQGEGSEWWTALNYSVINRLMPERATRR